MPEFKKHS